ncbi:MAG TPA: SAM-dependent DNA methyltransferase, partial [Candidatus Spyradenecus faecavium]|nr:SAM-dependent DNA methyltransferase [Candidatus Spyradenecus faecavium]
FLLNEVRPYAPDAYLDPAKTQVGYEISFTKYFYKPAELRTLNDILADLRALDAQAASLMHAITEEA